MNGKLLGKSPKSAGLSISTRHHKSMHNLNECKGDSDKQS